MRPCMLVVWCGVFILVFVQGMGYAQEPDAVPREGEYNLEYYMKTALNVQEIENMQGVVRARVSALQKKSERSREENLTLLKDAQLLGSLYTTIRNGDEKRAVLKVLTAVRDEFIAYASKNKHDYEVKTELAFLVHMGFVAYIEDFYQSVRLVQEMAAEVYNREPNAKVALMLGQSYLSANRAGLPLMVNALAERYLEKALELDGGSGYVSYLASIYFANLYFKTRKMDAARRYMDEAKALYPDGAFAYIVEDLFFANGKALF